MAHIVQFLVMNLSHWATKARQLYCSHVITVFRVVFQSCVSELCFLLKHFIILIAKEDVAVDYGIVGRFW